MLNWLLPDPYKKQKQQLRGAFPKAMEPEVNQVMETILFAERQIKTKEEKPLPVQGLVHSTTVDVQVAGESLNIPYRVYFNEPDQEQLASLTKVQQLILHCIYLRHHNGFIRQQHLEQLGLRYEYWVTPFVFQLLGEYVAEIVEVIYHQLDDQLLDNFQQLGKENPRYYQQTESRMVNYWSIYYKWRYPRLRSYPGYRIFQRLSAKNTTTRFLEIAEIGINAQGQLFIRPDNSSFEQIHSADPVIHWDAVNRWLYIPQPGPWSQLGWFRYIIKQCKRKYHCHLELTGRTIWTNIPDELKQQMLLDN